MTLSGVTAVILTWLVGETGAVVLTIVAVAVDVAVVAKITCATAICCPVWSRTG